MTFHFASGNGRRMPKAAFAPVRTHDSAKPRCGYCGKMNADAFHIKQCAEDAERMQHVRAPNGGYRRRYKKGAQ